MAEKVEHKWILAWLVVHSLVLVGVVLFMLFAVIVVGQKTDSMSVLLHQRISEIVSRTDKQQEMLTKLRLQYDPHSRIEALEKWQRTFCTGPKIEACAQLGKVKR